MRVRYYAGTFAGALTYGIFATRVGLSVGFIVAASLLVVNTLMLTLTQDATQWIVLRFFSGYLLGGLYVLSDSWITTGITKEFRGRIFGLYEALRLGAVSVGPTLILIGTAQEGFYLVAVFYALSILPILIGPKRKGKAGKQRHFAGMFEIAKRYPMPMLIGFCGGACNAAFYGLGPIYGSEIGMDKLAIATFSAVVLFAPIVSEVPVGLLSDRIGRMVTAWMLGLFALIAASVILVLNPTSLAMVIAPAFLFGFATVPIYGMALNHITDRTKGSDEVGAATATMVCYSFGGSMGPFLAGVAMEGTGPLGLYMVLGTLAGTAMTAAAVERFIDRPAVSHQH